MGSSNSLPNQRIAKIHFEIASLEWYCLEPYLGVKTLGFRPKSGEKRLK